MADLKPLSQKGINSIVNTGYLNCWEGAVRSSKTFVSSLAWVNYVSESIEQRFIMSGVSIGALSRNVLEGEFGMLNLLPPDMIDYKVTKDGNRVLKIYGVNGEKTCYCFGANDERSQTTLRGITAGGWYADEVSLQPRSFVEEALRRTIVSKDRKHFWTLNPMAPKHWIYKKYLDVYEETELDGFYLWHFTMDDNLSLTPERKSELAKQHAGVFYRRYILGERCVAEGAIYNTFTESNLYRDDEYSKKTMVQARRYIAFDHGTTNPCVFLEILDCGDYILVNDEFYWDSSDTKNGKFQKSNSQYAVDMENFMGTRKCQIVGDPRANGFVAELRTRGFVCKDDVNADVSEGIQKITTMFEADLIRINEERCPNLIRELEGYSWDEKKAEYGKEEPIKTDDHAPDALRYFIHTMVSNQRLHFMLKKSVKNKLLG